MASEQIRVRLRRRSPGLAGAAAFTFLALHAAGADDSIDWARAREFWSFRTPVAQARPAVRAVRWPRERIDYFILARLEQRGLAPSAEADRRTLIRRATFDLTGLPPTPEEVAAFLADSRPEAFERVVDRLLASPRFGERMASLWLPLARYAEDQAHQVGKDTKFFYPNAYKYRQWVIAAFNRDLPYSQFIQLQLAADLLESTNSPNLAALGFLGLGPKYYNRDRLDVMSDEWEDRVDTVGRTFLGLTVACARCHDHKFDPVTMSDYYALAGVFASTRMVNRLPDGKAEDSKASATNINPGTLHVVEEGEPKDLNIFLRGSVDRKGPVAERRFLRVLSEGEPQTFKEGSGRRELAAALADTHNPLTARVMVNRLWGWFFGRPLVSTPSNFGHSGDRPTHPELLDDLAVRFTDHGWSVKSLVREFVLSSTYRQPSGVESLKRSIVKSADKSDNEPSRFNDSTVQRFNGKTASSTTDPANEFFWRMNRRRLTIEQWRDAILFVSGELSPECGKSLELDDPENFRRTVYGRVSRLKLNDLLMQWDYPDANVHAEKRSATTTPMQKLFVLNSPFMIARASALAARVKRETSGNETVRIENAYQLLFARPPDRAERAAALEFLRKRDEGPMTRWEQFAQVLLASNEMLYVD
ncbi:MAG TPA: DUF1549 and DUF1553 domain-containing protein [Verrucomicrobiae bacterium]|nr:DUF1549 and DUF1553 domain-containing protein [Verrucomicrobiae bacterium]